MRLNAVQNYVNKIFNRGEINEEHKKLMRPTASQIGKAYGLPKIHKPCQHLPKFWPIIDTINTPYHSIGKFLTPLLNPLEQNNYVVKDFFEAAAKINSVSFGEISSEYTFISFDASHYSQTFRWRKLSKSFWTEYTVKRKFQQSLPKDHLKSYY